MIHDRREATASARNPAAALRRCAAATLLLVGMAGCDGLLDVENPNNVVQDDLSESSAARALVNGTLAKTSLALSTVATAHAGISDEFVWRGSFTAMDQLDHGFLNNDANRYTQDGFNELAVARWMGDETIEALEEFLADGSLDDPGLLARAYLYTGITYSTIPDMYENFAFSDRREPGEPVGEDQMHTIYDMAVEHLNSAVARAREVGDTDTEVAAIAVRARARWAKALWQKLAQGAAMTADPLISDDGADADAETVLARVTSDWKYRFIFSPTSQQNDVAFNANSRLEIAIADEWSKQDNTEKKICAPFNSNCPEDGTRVLDPIDNIKDPALRADMYEFVQAFVYAPLTVVSARELHLILAESALEKGDMGTFTTHINSVRAVTAGLTPYDPAVHTDIEPLELLEHERRVNLFNQVQRRLADLYRFGEVSPRWAPASEAIRSPGRVFPISVEERVANCNIGGECG